VDRYTFQIVLEEPLASLLAVLGLHNTMVVPREEVEKPGGRFGHDPVGTGPFKFVRWEPNQEIVLEANDQYYEGRPFLDAVVFKLAHVVDVDDVRMHHRRQNAAFLVEQFERYRIVDIEESFEGDLTVHERIVRLINDTHSPAAQHFAEFITFV